MSKIFARRARPCRQVQELAAFLIRVLRCQRDLLVLLRAVANLLEDVLAPRRHALVALAARRMLPQCRVADAHLPAVVWHGDRVDVKNLTVWCVQPPDRLSAKGLSQQLEVAIRRLVAEQASHCHLRRRRAFPSPFSRGDIRASEGEQQTLE